MIPELSPAMHARRTSIEFLTRHCVGYWTRKASRALTRHYNAHFAKAGLTASQFGLLAALSRHAEHSVTALADSLDADETTVVRGIQALQRRGLVRASGGRGRQTKRCRLTRKGGELLRRGLREWNRAYGEIEKRLGGRARAAHAVELLGQLVSAARTSL
jgi:DNA-binding MarR family transcriptional regulator